MRKLEKMLIKKPKIKFKALALESRVTILNLLRRIAKHSGLYFKLHQMGFGIEETEEIIIAFLDSGIFKIELDVNTEMLCLKVYDEGLKKYL